MSLLEAATRSAGFAAAAQPDIQPPLKDMDILVIGAGAGGLTAAKTGQERGANVTVLEKADDPRDPNAAGYAHRSYNFTVNLVGRQTLQNPRAWAGSAIVVGRAIHNFNGSGETNHTNYGKTPDAHLNSLTRPGFRHNLVDLSEGRGANLVFGAEVLDVDPETGKLVFQKDGKRTQLSTDLVVFADGIHSQGDGMEHAATGVEVKKTVDPRKYVSVMIPSSVGQANRLSTNHIHYWHEEAGADAYTIGVPNPDGSVGLLLISSFSDIDPEAHPFATPEEAGLRLKRDFPQILALDPTLPYRLPEREVGRFHHKSGSYPVLGKRGVKVGDAFVGFPPWAGFGANSAIHAGGELIQHLAQNGGDLQAGLSSFGDYYRALGRELSQYVVDHGVFLSDRVMTHPNERSAPALPELIRRARQATAA